MVEGDKMLTFLKECHKKSLEYFDNSPNILAEIPDDIKKLLGEKQQTQVWKEYLEYKFRFLLEPKMAVEKIESELIRGKKEYLREFISDWKKYGLEEQLTHKYRYIQLPEEAILDRWYWTAKVWACNEWCNRRSTEMQRLTAKTLESPEAILKDIYQKLNDKYSKIADKQDYVSLDFEDEYVLTSIYRQALQNVTQTIDEVYSYLSKAPLDSGFFKGSVLRKCQEVLKHIEENLTITRGKEYMSGYAPLGEDFLSDLFTKLVQALYEEEFDETALIQGFLAEIKERFMCEVCDFLEVTENGRRVSWRIGTVNHEDLSEEYRSLPEEQVIKKVQEFESYKRGEGISGSILLLTNASRNIWYHVGSNDVYADPRQSTQHRSIYETKMYPGVLKVTKKINNFWAFPIFRGSELKGTFRVVNKLTEDGKALQPGGWPYHSRVELALIGQWFSRFLTAIQLQIREKAEWTTVFKRKNNIKKLIKEKLRLSWVNEEKFKGMLRHLMRIVSQKQEERHIGCSMIVAEIPSGVHPLRHLGLDPYPFLKPNPGDMEYPYEGFDSYHGLVNPLEGAYILNPNGEFQIIASLNYADGTGKLFSGVDTMKFLTKHHENLLCLLLAPETRVIRIYQKGNVAAELYLSEVGGEWEFRYPDEILEKINSKASDCVPGVSEFICEACLELSFRGFGGTIVFGDIQKEDFEFKTTKPQEFNEDNPLAFGVELFVDIVKFEGATFLNKDGRITQLNVLVDVKHDAWEREKHKFKGLFSGKGSRHNTAEKISVLAAQALVVVVSQNRTVSILNGGELLGSF